MGEKKAVSMQGNMVFVLHILSMEGIAPVSQEHYVEARFKVNLL